MDTQEMQGVSQAGKKTTNRRAEFFAKHGRRPNAEEEKQIAELERQDRREADAQRHEAELRRAFMAQPGADEAGWEREKAGILADDRRQRMQTERAAARARFAQRY